MKWTDVLGYLMIIIYGWIYFSWKYEQAKEKKERVKGYQQMKGQIRELTECMNQLSEHQSRLVELINTNATIYTDNFKQQYEAISILIKHVHELREKVFITIRDN